MKHKTFFAVLVAAVVMTGCLKVQKKSEVAAQNAQAKSTQTQSQKAPISRELRLDDVFVEYVGQRRPNAYDVLLSWPATRDSVRVSVDGKVLFTEKTSAIQNFTMTNLNGGAEFSITIEILDEKSRVLASETRDLEIPEDYVFPEQFVLTYDTKIYRNRVFMNGSVITTQNFKLEIKTKELIILNDSSIQGFATGTKAGPGNTGRSGGLINIEAELAAGLLNVNLNSEAGGDGLTGYYVQRLSGGKEKQDVFSPRCVEGGSGYNAGRNGDLRLKVNNIDNFYVASDNSYSLGGSRGPRLGHAPQAYPQMAEGSSCTDNPTSGAAAQAGMICLLFPGLTPVHGCE